MDAQRNSTLANYAWVYLGLLALLAATVAVSNLPLGGWGSLLSLAIAVGKTFLVVYFFMKLRTASPGLRVIALAGVFWLFLLGSITFGDYLSRMSFGVLGK